jgi:hypothetical protein
MDGPERHRMTSMGSPAPRLFLDFDGVLHPDDVYLVGGRPVLKAPGALLMWAPLLETALTAHPAVRIVLSTSWARWRGYARARRALPQQLRERVIGATWHSAMGRSDGGPNTSHWAHHQTWWDRATRYAQIRRYVSQAGVRHWVAIDDDVYGWADHERHRLVATLPETGLAGAGVLDRLGLVLDQLNVSGGTES